MLSDIEIATSVKMKMITEIAQQLDIHPQELEPYGHYKAKLSSELFDRLASKSDGKLILVTAINPTPAGEGKTTTTVGLGQAMWKLGKKAMVTLREPSLGPVFGIKGGAAGGGYSQVVPMEDINLHFTGDFHAITSANNLLCAMLDNHIHQGNTLNIDPRRILIKRCVDMNDRSLRHIVIGLGGKANSITREDSFQITVASEVMAILCLADDISDLKERLGKILVAYTYDGKLVTAAQLNANGAMSALLKDAIKPNLVQTLEGTPALIHGGPFANIAHGCNSVRATKLALKLSDYCITEAGFGSDLGAEKFFDIKCRKAGLKPDAVVLVTTVRALRYNGGVPKTEVSKPDFEAVKTGIVNLGAHIDNLRRFGVPVVVAVNRFDTDSEDELQYVFEYCQEKNVDCATSDVFANGGAGGIELAEKVMNACERESELKLTYETDQSIKEKINAIATKVYGADGVEYSAAAEKSISEVEAAGAGKLPVCIAKTQYSLSDDPAKLGRPHDFKINVYDIRLSAGAGFIVVYTGDIMTLPGLPRVPSAEKIDIDEHGEIKGLS